MTTTDVGKLDGLEVITKDGRQLGVVKGVQINTDQWKVEALNVRLDKAVCEELELSRKIFGSTTVGIRTEHIGACGDTIVLNTTLAELERSREGAFAHRPPDEVMA